MLSDSGIETAKMFKALLPLTTFIVAVVTRDSPNARLVEERFYSPEGSRYSDNILEDALLDAVSWGFVLSVEIRIILLLRIILISIFKILLVAENPSMFRHEN